MNTLLALAVTSAIAGSPAQAETCPSAEALEQRLGDAPVAPFVAGIEPAKPDPAWRIGALGGFVMAAPPLGEILTFRHAVIETSCGLRIRWTPVWDGAVVRSAGQFKVERAAGKSEPRASEQYGATLFRLTPDRASQTAWLSMTYGGRTSDYLLNFPATALAVGPVSHHSGGVWLEVMGVRADGALIYADFGGSEPR